MAEALKQVQGLWLPAHEQHLEGWLAQRMREHPEEMVGGRASYQYHKLLAAMNFVRRFRVAVDIGAHCGLWSMQLVKRFKEVHAFEPVPLHRTCFAKNVEAIEQTPGTLGRAFLHPFALGAERGFCRIATTSGSSGDSWVQSGGDVEMRTLDSFGLKHVDFVKIDCEGYELFALKGAEETLRRCRPAIIVEQKPNRATRFGLGQKDALPWLESLGAVLRAEMSGDFIFSWDEEMPPAVETVERMTSRRRRSES